MRGLLAGQAGGCHPQRPPVRQVACLNLGRCRPASAPTESHLSASPCRAPPVSNAFADGLSKRGGKGGSEGGLLAPECGDRATVLGVVTVLLLAPLVSGT